MPKQPEVFKSSKLRARNALPSWVEDDSPRLFQFITYYFKWLSEKGEPYWYIENLENFTDLDTSVDEFFDYLKNEYMANFPAIISSDMKLLMRNIMLFYLEKGNETSFQFLFRALFDSFISFYYPKVDVLRASDGKWIEPFYLYPEELSAQEMADFIGVSIVGKTSGATAIIDRTVPYAHKIDDDTTEIVTMFELYGMNGIFLAGEDVVAEQDLEATIFKVAENGIYKGNGYWKNTDGFISWDKYIQDSYYYQDFSYVITSTVQIDEWRDIVKALVHPAGFQFFGRVNLSGDDEDSYFEHDVEMELMNWIIEWFNGIDAIVHLEDSIYYIISLAKHFQHVPETYDNAEYNKEFVLDCCVNTPLDALDSQTLDWFESKTTRENIMVFTDEGLKVDPYDINFATFEYNGLETEKLFARYFPNREYSYERVVTNSQGIFQPKIRITNAYNMMIFIDGKYIHPSGYVLVLGNEWKITADSRTIDVYYPNFAHTYTNIPYTLRTIRGIKEYKITIPNVDVGGLFKHNFIMFSNTGTYFDDYKYDKSQHNIVFETMPNIVTSYHYYLTRFDLSKNVVLDYEGGKPFNINITVPFNLI